jgi:hypothetical protein
MTIQDQYTSTVRQAQETWSGVADSISENIQKAVAQSRAPFATIDPTDAIDQVFDFWKKTLDVQRDFAKQVVGVSVAVTDRVREKTESVSHAVREQAVRAQRVAREQAESSQQAADERAAEKYEAMTKAELQDELASRDLPKTGNVDELRERLIEDDQK